MKDKKKIVWFVLIIAIMVEFFSPLVIQLRNQAISALRGRSSEYCSPVQVVRHGYNTDCNGTKS